MRVIKLVTRWLYRKTHAEELKEVRDDYLAFREAYQNHIDQEERPRAYYRSEGMADGYLNACSILKLNIQNPWDE